MNEEQHGKVVANVLDAMMGRISSFEAADYIVELFNTAESVARIDENKKLLSELNRGKMDKDVRMFYYMRPILKKRIKALSISQTLKEP